jgi:Ran GTPase-activating protein (RanGAP) involved in mRNA processing and transport
MIAEMIKQNTNLISLNVENNNLDSECACVLAESLQYNNKLKILNLRKNKLGDTGIIELLKPLIK